MNNKKDRDAFTTALLWLIAAVIVWFLTSCTTAGEQDLFVDSLSRRATADVLLQQAQLQEQFLTSTAQAPIINITSTAAAFAMQQSYAQATSAAGAQTQVAAMTVTAQSWTPTPNAASTAMFLALNAQSTQTQLALEKQQTNNQFWAIIPGVIVVALLFAGIMGLVWFSRRERFRPATVDERGRIVPMFDFVEGTATDVEKMPNYRGEMKEDLFKQLIMRYLDLKPSLPAVTAERQDLVTARAQLVDMATRARLPKRLLDEQERLLLPALSRSTEENKFQLPSWELINSWDGKSGIPYYTAIGIEIIDIERFPHLSVLGATSTGKSRRFLRPMIACALAAGHRVVIIGKSADYKAFEGHPNATLLRVSQLTEESQAQRYADILEAVVVEMNRRDDVLISVNQSTWTHAGRNRTWIILDELGNALSLMNSFMSKRCEVLIKGLVNESRKVGFNIALANQRATGMSSFLSQTGKAIFRVESDEEKAHRSLAGASTLHDGYFLAKFGVPKIAGAFEPSDEQIRTFLASRPVDKVDDDDQWIEGVLSDAPAKLPDENKTADDAPSSLSQLVDSLDDKGLKVLELFQAGGMSDSEIGELAYGYSNGTIVRRVKSIIERYRNLTIATTTTQNSPNLGAVPA